MSEVIGQLFLALLKAKCWIFIALALAGWIVLFVPPISGVDSAPLRVAGAWIWIATIAFTALAGVCSVTHISQLAHAYWSRLRNPSLRITPVVNGCRWFTGATMGSAPATQIILVLDVLNVEPHALHVAKVWLIRPHRKSTDVLPISIGFDVPPQRKSQHRVDFMVRDAVVDQGPLFVTIGLMDQIGRTYRVNRILVQSGR